MRANEKRAIDDEKLKKKKITALPHFKNKETHAWRKILIDKGVGRLGVLEPHRLQTVGSGSIPAAPALAPPFGSAAQ